MKRVLVEAILVAAAGAIIAFAANGLSPKGLKLERDYFPSDRQGISASGSNSNVTTAVAPTNASLTDVAIQKLREKGLQVLDTEAASSLFRDERFQQGLIVFVDARNSKHFEEGHIPGAYKFDHYHPEGYLPIVAAACQVAEEVIVYCTGGDCEDSQNAAIFLRDSLSLNNGKLFVYVGGIQAWEAAGLPLETGQRNSGAILAKPK